MPKLRIFSAAAAGAAALALALTAMSVSAQPHGFGPGPGFGHAPSVNPHTPVYRPPVRVPHLAPPGMRPPLVRPAPPPAFHRPPPPPRHHYSWHTRDWAWVWGPLAAGALVYGATSALRDDPPVNTYVVPQTTPSYPGSSSTTTTTTTTTTGAVFWCEAEQGWWPQVRACPTGWKAMPAP